MNRTDPSGLRFSYGGFARGVNRFLGELGVGATALSLLPGRG